MKRKEKRLRLKFDFVTLLVIVLGFIIVIGGCSSFKKSKSNISSKNIIMEEIKEDEEKETAKTEKVTKIKIDDNIVKDLYGRVTSGDGEYKYWMYTDYNTITDLTANISMATASEIIKMNLVGNSIDIGKVEKVECTNAIPDVINSSRSVCSYNKVYKANFDQIGYKKSYIESIYQNIFGTTLSPNSEIPLYLAPNSGEVYYYIQSLDMYLKYFATPKNIVSGGNYIGKISNVTQDNNQLKLLEDVTNGENKIKFRYTFEKQDSGNYIFISREKEQ